MLANKKTLLLNKNEELHSRCITQINDFHDQLLKERTNYIALESRYNILEMDFNNIKKENRELNIKVNDLYLTQKYHNKDSMTMEDIKKKVKEEMNQYINIKETIEYIEIKNINEKYNKKILQLESDIEKLQLESKIEDNKLFIHIKKQNINLLDSNCKLDAQVKDLISKIESKSINKNELDNKTDKQETLIQNSSDIKKPILENIGNINEDISSKDKTLKNNIIKTTKINKSDEIVNVNINKIIKKIDKLYDKNFTNEQLTVNKALIKFYSDIYDLIKNKDEKKDAKYINDMIDSASTDTNKTRFKKILKVSNFINNNTFLKESSIVIPLYIFKIIPINSLDILFSNINDYFKIK